MHGRQRSVGNGYRSNSFGMGMSSSRYSPERPMRGHGFYGPEHRGYSRGYGRGRGRSKSYQNQLPPPLPPSPVQRKSGSIFMEAGRLAAEYLVSQGVLPQTVLSSKWQNGNFRKQAGEFQSSRSEEARVDVSVPPADRRRYVDGYSSAGSRNDMKGKRSHRYDTDFGRDCERSGSWSERNKGFEVETGDDSVSAHREEQPLAEDIASSVQRSASGEFMRKREGAGDSESMLDKYNLQDEAQSKTGSSSAGKEIIHDSEISKVSEGSSSLSAASGEMKARTGNCEEIENHNAIEDASAHQHGEAGEELIKSSIDLATLCKFEKVPTRTRSSLTAKGPKLYSSQNSKEISYSSGLPEENQTSHQRETQGQSSGKANSADFTDDENFDSTDQVGDLGIANFVEKSKCQRSNSFPDSILRDNSEKDSGLELPNMHRSYSVGRVGEKRAGEGSDLEEEAKRQKEPSPASEANEFFNIFKTSEIQGDPEEEKTSSFNKGEIDGGGNTTSDKSSIDNSIRNRIHEEKSGTGYGEERQLFPASFKMCDLNLGGALNAGNLGDPMISCPTFVEAKRESDQVVDFDLSISSSSKSLEYSTSTRMSNGKEIEVIDLDNDSPEVVKAMNDSRIKQEAGPYMGFTHQPQASTGIHDVPDYNEGLMIEFLDSFGNIPPLNPGINTVSEGVSHMPQNEVGLQEPEGGTGSDQVTHTDDDSIFMSLGEIPLTFLQAWDHPPARGYEKPF